MGKPTYFETAAAFRVWLAAHGATAAELLVGYHKVGSGRPSMSWPESVDEALCYGWIDGMRRRIDAQRYSIRFTPRRPTSIWSAVNIAKFEQLVAEGRMTSAGVAAHAHRSESKSRVYAFEQAAMPELSAEEQRRFRHDRPAWAFFESTPPGYRKLIVHWIVSAKKPETRAVRLAKLMQASAIGERLR